MINYSACGFHSSFYYFGLEHLIINMYQYIKDSIKRKEKVYIYMDFEVYKKLLKYVGTKNNCIEYFDITEAIKCYKKLEIKKIKEEISKYTSQVIGEGYEGIRFIIQVDYAISHTSQGNFLSFDKDVLTISSSAGISCMCIYDFEDYLSNKKFINEKVINESYKINPYRLYNGKLEKSSELIHAK